jgi:PleD family two-component response regulator
MENIYNRRFDLPALLRINEIDIRVAAAINPALRIDQYYRLLAKFVIKTPFLVKTLNRIAALEGEKTEFQIVASMENMLRNLGCDKFAPVIDDIVESGKMDHKEFSALYAEKLSKDIADLSDRIKNTEKKEEKKPVKKQEKKAISDDSGPSEQAREASIASFEQIPLSRFVGQLEYREATRKMRILAIDDSPVMLHTISSVLSKDYIVYRMENPTMLENFLNQVTPELFLLDYKMPELSGFDLIPIIRNFEEHKNTPIVFLTSEGSSDHVSSALSLGARDFIIKPFKPDTLLEKVARNIVRKNFLEKKVA